MSTKKQTKMTLEMLINKKLQKESTEIKFKEIYAKKINGTLLFRIPNDDEIMEYIDSLGDNKTIKNIKKVYTTMIYDCCEMLHKKELHEAYSIVDPLDIVSLMFTTKDILAIGNEIMGETGIGETEDAIKN